MTEVAIKKTVARGRFFSLLLSSCPAQRLYISRAAFVAVSFFLLFYARERERGEKEKEEEGERAGVVMKPCQASHAKSRASLCGAKRNAVGQMRVTN